MSKAYIKDSLCSGIVENHANVARSILNYYFLIVGIIYLPGVLLMLIMWIHYMISACRYRLH